MTGKRAGATIHPSQQRALAQKKGHEMKMIWTSEIAKRAVMLWSRAYTEDLRKLDHELQNQAENGLHNGHVAERFSHSCDICIDAVDEARKHVRI